MNILGSMLLMTMMVGVPQEGAEGKVFPYPIDVHDFDNGLRLVGVQFDSPGLAAYYTVVRVGARQEVDEGKSGFAHFFEHMMFRGTEAFPEEEYNDVLRAIGADSNAYTSSDRTVYHILASSRSLPRTIEIEAESLPTSEIRESTVPERGRRCARGVQQERRQSFHGPLREAPGHGL